MIGGGISPQSAVRFYAYGVVRIDTPTPEPVHVAMTRREARQAISGPLLDKFSPQSLRVRRARVSMYHNR